MLHLREMIIASMSVLYVNSVMSQKLPGDSSRSVHYHAFYEESVTGVGGSRGDLRMETGFSMLLLSSLWEKPNSEDVLS